MYLSDFDTMEQKDVYADSATDYISRNIGKSSFDNVSDTWAGLIYFNKTTRTRKTAMPARNIVRLSTQKHSSGNRQLTITFLGCDELYSKGTHISFGIDPKNQKLYFFASNQDNGWKLFDTKWPYKKVIRLLLNSEIDEATRPFRGKDLRLHIEGDSIYCNSRRTSKCV